MSRKWNSQIQGYSPQIMGFAPSQQSSELSRTGAAILAALTDAVEGQTKAGKILRAGSTARRLFDRSVAVVAQGQVGAGTDVAASETDLRDLARAVLEANREARDADALSVEARASYERLQAALRIEEAEALAERLRRTG